MVLVFISKNWWNIWLLYFHQTEASTSFFKLVIKITAPSSRGSCVVFRAVWKCYHLSGTCHCDFCFVTFRLVLLGDSNHYVGINEKNQGSNTFPWSCNFWKGSVNKQLRPPRLCPTPPPVPLVYQLRTFSGSAGGQWPSGLVWVRMTQSGTAWFTFSL